MNTTPSSEGGHDLGEPILDNSSQQTPTNPPYTVGQTLFKRAGTGRYYNRWAWWRGGTLHWSFKRPTKSLYLSTVQNYLATIGIEGDSIQPTYVGTRQCVAKAVISQGRQRAHTLHTTLCPLMVNSGFWTIQYYWKHLANLGIVRFSSFFLIVLFYL